MLISKISPKIPEKFPLNPVSKKNSQLKTNQSLAIAVNEKQKSIEKEQILLAKIKHLEEQLKKTATERDNLKIEKEKAKALSQIENSRADNYQQQLKTIVKTLYQLQKASYYQQLNQEQKAQMEQSPKPPDNLRSRN